MDRLPTAALASIIVYLLLLYVGKYAEAGITAFVWLTLTALSISHRARGRWWTLVGGPVIPFGFVYAGAAHIACGRYWANCPAN